MVDRRAFPAPIPPLTVAARKRIEDAIEMLMAQLDAADAPFEDLEPSLGYDMPGVATDAEHDVCDWPHDDVGDEEPELGATTAIDQRIAWSRPRDAMAAFCFTGGDVEPSLGWCGVGIGHPQAAMRGYDQDREVETL